MKRLLLFVNMLAVLAVATQFTACLKDESPYRAGFQFIKPTYVRTFVYANTATDSVELFSYNAWKITSDMPVDWCTLDAMNGSGNTVSEFCVNFQQNTTGQPRLTQFTVTDTSHPDDARATWQYLQYATRGDGSFGNAALVKRISSSDGWEVVVSYDSYCRPTQVAVSAPDGNKETYRMAYNEVTKQLTVTKGTGSLSGTMDNGYQTEKLQGANDTLGYTPQYYPNGVEMSANYAFNYVSATYKRTQAYAYLMGGKSLAPDSLHTADSLIYYSRWNVASGTYEVKPTTIEHYKLEYSQMDNRCQTVDVNQLMLGMDDCEPMQLISMFRLCRSTSIVKRATSADGVIDVSAELNSDSSVHRLVVTDSRKNTTVTYDFTY